MDDSRKRFVQVTVANYFGIPIEDQAITSLTNDSSLNSFLDDGNVPVLAATLDGMQGKKVDLQNKVSGNVYDVARHESKFFSQLIFERLIRTLI